MRAFETAFGMQMAVPEVFDFSRETEATHSLYGLEHGQTAAPHTKVDGARRPVRVAHDWAGELLMIHPCDRHWPTGLAAALGVPR